MERRMRVRSPSALRCRARENRSVVWPLACHLGASALRGARHRVRGACASGCGFVSTSGQSAYRTAIVREVVFDERTLSLLVVVVLIALVALAAWVAWLQRSETLLRRRLRRILPEGEASGIDEILDRQHKRLDSLSERHEALTKLHHELEALTHRTIQKVGVIRYNPFPDTGGDQSFAIALLDSQGSGVVLSSLHSRTDTRVFAKPVQGGRSRYPLSEEEQDAIQKALAPAS